MKELRKADGSSARNSTSSGDFDARTHPPAPAPSAPGRERRRRRRITRGGTRRPNLRAIPRAAPPPSGGLNRIFGTVKSGSSAPPAVKRVVCRDDPKKARAMARGSEDRRVGGGRRRI